MDVTATYRIVGEGAAVKAVRQGDLAIFPPGFDPQGDKQLSAAQTVIRRLLQRRLGNVLKDEIVPEELVLPEKWRRAGKLRLVQWTAEDGWLSLPGTDRDSHQQSAIPAIPAVPSAVSSQYPRSQLRRNANASTATTAARNCHHASAPAGDSGP